MAMKVALVVALLGTAMSVGAGALVWRFGYYAAPFAWTGEPARLAAALGLAKGCRSPISAPAAARWRRRWPAVVGDRGLVYATELSPARRDQLARRVAAARLDNVRVVAAGAVETGLPARCCDAVYLRTVFHHVVRPDGVRGGGRAQSSGRVAASR